jgi:hypothetical protein
MLGTVDKITLNVIKQRTTTRALKRMTRGY